MFSMGMKLKDLEDKTKSPGAGTYNQSKDSINHKSPNYSMGAKLKSDLEKNKWVPGPGTYVNNTEKLRNTSPSYGFGSM